MEILLENCNIILGLQVEQIPTLIDNCHRETDGNY